MIRVLVRFHRQTFSLHPLSLLLEILIQNVLVQKEGNYRDAVGEVGDELIIVEMLSGVKGIVRQKKLKHVGTVRKKNKHRMNFYGMIMADPTVNFHLPALRG